MERFILVFAQWTFQEKIGRQCDLGPTRLVLNTARHWLFFFSLHASEVQNLRLIHASHIKSDCKLFISALKKFQWNMCIRQWKHVVSDDFSASPSVEHRNTKWRVTSLILYLNCNSIFRTSTLSYRKARAGEIGSQLCDMELIISVVFLSFFFLA